MAILATEISVGPCISRSTIRRSRSKKNTTMAASRNAKIRPFLQFKFQENYDLNARDIHMNEHVKYLCETKVKQRLLLCTLTSGMRRSVTRTIRSQSLKIRTIHTQCSLQHPRMCTLWRMSCPWLLIKF